MRKISGIILFIVYSFIVAELSTRLMTSIFTVFDLEMLKYSQNLKRYSKSKNKNFRHKKNKKIQLMNVSVKTNGLGLRDTTLSAKRSLHRTIFLGDSFTFGWGVPQNEIFAHRIEEQLSDKLEILNFGHCNYNTQQEIDLFKELGLSLAPDSVFMFYFLNDIEPTLQEKGIPLWTYSHFLALLKSRFLYFFSKNDYRTYYQNYYMKQKPYWSDQKTKIIDFKNHLKKNGIKFYFILLPDFHQFAPYPFSNIHNMIKTELKDNGIQVVDTLQVFDGEKNSQKYWVARDDPHPNSQAHEKIADFLLSTLKETTAEGR